MKYLLAGLLAGLTIGLIAGYAIAPRTYSRPESFREGLWKVTTRDGRVYRRARIKSSDCALGLVLTQGRDEIHVREYSTMERDD